MKPLALALIATSAEVEHAPTVAHGAAVSRCWRTFLDSFHQVADQTFGCTVETCIQIAPSLGIAPKAFSVFGSMTVMKV
jgi:hypothetical protein